MGRRSATRFVCQECGAQSPGWLGRCPECGGWDSLIEEVVTVGSAAAEVAADAAEPIDLSRFAEDELSRNSTGMHVLDRVLGGGLVPGSAVLLAGEPGIGKSTLLLQLAGGLAPQSGRVLYLSAEESGRQLRLRADRLRCEVDGLDVIAGTSLEPVLQRLATDPWRVVLVDSVQAVRTADLSSPPGSISQVRQVANTLVEHCKQRDITLVLVGHITKGGAIAGPKSLEHLVDTVLSFEGDGEGEYRILRTTKNRFGPAGEVAMFEMHDTGLTPVSDPSRVLLSRRRPESPGSAVTASLQGLRPVLVEVQALVHTTSFPSPRRMAVGCDANRLALLVAVLERFAGLSFADKDLFVNVVGGLTVREPAADLAIAAALISALSDRSLPRRAVFFGEIGLLGEIRPVSRVEARLREAEHLGYDRAIAAGPELSVPGSDLAIEVVRDVRELLTVLAGTPVD